MRKIKWIKVGLFLGGVIGLYAEPVLDPFGGKTLEGKTSFIDGLAVDTEKDELSLSDEALWETPKVPRRGEASLYDEGFKPVDFWGSLEEDSQQNQRTTLVNRKAVFDNLMEEKDYRRALVEVETIMASNGKTPELLMNAAILATLAGKFPQAQVYFLEFQKLQPFNSDEKAAFATVHFSLRQYNEAKQLCGEVLQTEPEHLRAQFLLLVCQLAQEEETSEASINRWKSSSLESLSAIANWLVEEQHIPLKENLGIDSYKRMQRIVFGGVVQDQLRSLSSVLKDGISELFQRNWNRALIYLELAKEYGVNTPELNFHIAQCLYETGDHTQALTLLHDLIEEEGKKYRYVFNYGLILIKSKLYDQAYEMFSRAVDMEESSGMTRFALACSLAGLDRMDEAWEILDELSKSHTAYLTHWLTGDSEYLVKIRADERFGELLTTLTEKTAPY